MTQKRPQRHNLHANIQYNEITRHLCGYCDGFLLLNVDRTPAFRHHEPEHCHETVACRKELLPCDTCTYSTLDPHFREPGTCVCAPCRAFRLSQGLTRNPEWRRQGHRHASNGR
jgi:hypothetical protein